MLLLFLLDDDDDDDADTNDKEEEDIIVVVGSREVYRVCVCVFISHLMCLRLIKVTGFPQSISTLVTLRARIYYAAHTHRDQRR